MSSPTFPLRAPFSVVLFTVVLWLVSCAPTDSTAPGVSKRILEGGFVRIFLLILENQDASVVRELPYLRSLSLRGIEFTNAHGVTRPSQPNYLALFAGTNGGVSDNNSHDLSGPNLYTRFRDSGLDCISFAQALPSNGFRGDAYPYVRKHNPAASFPDIPAEAIRPLTDFDLCLAGAGPMPCLSILIPDMLHGMHDNSAASGDAWLSNYFEPILQWALSNRTLCIVTFDEPDPSVGRTIADNPIYTVFAGHGVNPGVSSQWIDHYAVLKFILDSFSLPALAHSSNAAKIVW